MQPPPSVPSEPDRPERARWPIDRLPVWARLALATLPALVIAYELAFLAIIAGGGLAGAEPVRLLSAGLWIGAAALVACPWQPSRGRDCVCACPPASSSASRGVSAST